MANSQINRILKLMGLSEQVLTEQATQQTVTKTFGSNVFVANSSKIDKTGTVWKEIVGYFQSEYISKKVIPQKLTILGSASALRNTGEAEKMTHEQLSTARATNLKNELIAQFPALEKTTITINGKGFNGDGTSGPSDVYGTGSKGNFQEPPQEVIDAAKAGNREVVLEFYKQFQFAQLSFQGVIPIEGGTQPIPNEFLVEEYIINNVVGEFSIKGKLFKPSSTASDTNFNITREEAIELYNTTKDIRNMPFYGLTRIVYVYDEGNTISKTLGQTGEFAGSNKTSLSNYVQLTFAQYMTREDGQKYDANSIKSQLVKNMNPKVVQYLQNANINVQEKIDSLQIP